MNVFFNSQDIRYKEPFGAVPTGTHVSFRIEAAEADGVVLRGWTDLQGETRTEMHRDGGFFVCSLDMPSEPGLFWYYFLIYKGEDVFYYGNNEKQLGGAGMLCDFEPDSFQITVHKPMQTPEWFKHAIVYYIFPDRFFRGSDFEERKKAAERPEANQP